MTTKTKTKKTSKKPQTMEELLASTKHTIKIPRKSEKIKGIITEKTKRALYLDIGAKTEAVVIDKEYDLAADYIKDLEVGQEIEAVVSSAENERGQILLSLKQVAIQAKWEYFQEALDKQTILEAKGLEVNKGGLIILINGIRGFVPSSQFGKEMVGRFSQLKGQTLSVRAIEVDREKNRLIFSERHVSEATELAQRAKALEMVKDGAIHEGVVSGVMHFGLFVDVEVPLDKKTKGNVEGLVHISEISWEKVGHPKDYHNKGDKVSVKILGVDPKTHKLNLSIKQLQDDPWQSVGEKYPSGTNITGTVSRVEPFGVFVNVEPGIDGLIHASKLDPNQTFRKDDEVTVTVESVDPKQRRMSLSVVLTEVPVGYK